MKLRTKLSIFTALLFSTVVVTATGAYFWSERERIYRDFQNKRTSITQILEVISHDAIVGNDHLPLIRYLLELKANNPELVWAGVQHAGQFIAHTNSQWIGKSPVDSDTLKAISATSIIEINYIQDGKEILEVAVPIRAGDSRIGTVRVGFSKQAITDKFNKLLKKATMQILQVAFPVLILGIIASILFARTMTQRLTQLVEGSRSLATGNFSQQISIKGSDEIQELAQEFNQMSQELAKLYGKVKEQSDVLAQANIELLRLDSIKKNFFSLVSHELRGPLTTIKGYLSILQDTQGMEGWEKQERQIQIIREETDRIAKMVSEFLDLSRIETGTLHIEMKLIHTKLLVEFIVDRMEMEAENQQIKFSWYINEGTPDFVGDSERIAQVLINLIVNAIKFTPPQGNITMEVGRILKGRRIDDQHQILFRIRDTGKGIPKEHLEKIFERYYQIQGEERGRGLGLGLAFAKDVVELHGGEIWAESEGPGLGSTFTFTIPIKEENQEVIPLA